MLWPATITVHLHDTIDISDLSKDDTASLRERVQAIVSAPIEQAMNVLSIVRANKAKD
jgi:hypothetical protein